MKSDLYIKTDVEREINQEVEQTVCFFYKCTLYYDDSRKLPFQFSKEKKKEKKMKPESFASLSETLEKFEKLRIL